MQERMFCVERVVVGTDDNGSIALTGEGQDNVSSTAVPGNRYLCHTDYSIVQLVLDVTLNELLVL